MKKIVSLVLACVLMLGVMFTLASCGNISEAYAEKVNNAAKDDKHFTLAQVLEDLGDEAIDITDPITHSGVVVAIKGCETKEDYENLIKNGPEKATEGIVITIALSKATAAKYEKFEPKEDK